MVTQCTLTVAVAVRETKKVLLMELEDHAHVILFVPVVNHRHNGGVVEFFQDLEWKGVGRVGEQNAAPWRRGGVRETEIRPQLRSRLPTTASQWRCGMRCGMHLP